MSFYWSDVGSMTAKDSKIDVATKTYKRLQVKKPTQPYLINLKMTSREIKKTNQQNRVIQADVLRWALFEVLCLWFKCVFLTM